jgi:hypothetical protein
MADLTLLDPHISGSTLARALSKSTVTARIVNNGKNCMRFYHYAKVEIIILLLRVIFECYKS